MKIKFSKVFENKLKKLGKRDKKLLEKIEKKIGFFSNNVNHPSLRLHKLESTIENLWSVSIDRKMRMIFVWDENENVVYFTDIGSHEQVYR